jgi:hypothetical protein
MKEPKVLLWDLETGGVNAFYADLGFVFCFGYKWLGEKETHVLRVSDYQGWFNPARDCPVDDRELLKHALEIMEEADVLIAHYGDKFDRRFFQGRCVIQGLMPPPDTKQRDTWRIARTNFAFRSNRLGALADHLGLSEQKHQKTRREWPGWWLRGMAGSKDAIEEMAVYCAQDVRTLEQVYLRLRPYDALHPSLIYDRATCKFCGSAVRYHGYKYLQTHRYRRFQCTNIKCGKWDRERKPSDAD